MKLNTPTLYTDRLLLKGFEAEQIMSLFRQLSQKELMDLLSIESEEHYQLMRNNFYEKATHSKRVTFYTYLIYEAESGQLIGDCTYHLIWRKHDRAEIGYGLWNEKYRRNGYMSEALAVVLDKGFREFKFQRIEAFTAEDNIPSMRLLQSFGFHREGLTQKHYVINEGEEATHSLAWGLLSENFRLKVTTNPLVRLVESFERHSLPINEWTHEAHLSVALWYIYHEGLEKAMCKIRPGIITYNAAMGIPNTSERGYHETLTLFWMQQISQFLEAHKEKELEECHALFIHSDWADKDRPFQYYSKERLMSVKARGQWVAPDIP
jgi:RimJ/RimL family protein N-acetyltransferase